jgi:superfamily II DNA or RNA helicase
MRTGDRVTLRGERWTVLETADHGECETVRLAQAGRPVVRTFILPFDRPRLELTRAFRPRVVRPRRALHYLCRAAVRVHPFGGLIAAAGSTIDLLPYQLAPALAVLRHGWTRVLIADDAGLGKTIQAGLIAAELRARSASARVLILVPAGLRSQWAGEMRSRFGIEVTSADSTWLRAAGAELPSGTNPWTLPEIYVASHDFVKRPEVLRPLEDVSWDLLVVDEAHLVTEGTDRRGAVHGLACRARRVVLLTATPHDADPSQRAALTRIGATALETSWIAFRRARSIVAPGPRRRSRIVLIRPSEPERRMHRLLEEYTRRVWREACARGDSDARLASIILRKRALSSAGSLAASVRRRIDLLADPPDPGELQMSLPLADEDPLEDAEPMGALAAPGLADARLEARWLAAILETARHASLHEAKMRTLLRLLRRLREPAIVFTEYRDTLARLRAALKSRGIEAAILHGGMSAGERDAARRALDTGAPLLLATDAAAEGLNLQTRCRMVIHYELPWNPARLEQRAGRVDRIGQSRRAHEMALVADDTAERLVLEPIMRRAALSRRTGGARVFQALAESRVVAAVMAGESVEGSSTPATDDLTEHDYERRVPELADEARIEAERLVRCRQWAVPSAEHEDDRRANATAVGRTSRDVRGDWVYRLTVRSEDGQLQHGELLAVRVPGISSASLRSAGAVRSTIEQVRRARAEEIEALLAVAARDRIARTSIALAAARRRQQEREQAIAETTGSAARRLVQRGLFERPSRQPARAPAPAPLHSPIPPLLHASIDLIAVLLWR